MALGFKMNGGGAGGGNADIIPIVKYDARAGRLARRDYENGEYVNNDISRNFRAVADLENIEQGWIDFNTGHAPDFCVDHNSKPFPNQPSTNHKQGFRMLMKLGKECGGDIREMAGNSQAILRGIDQLHDEYVKGVIDNPGKLPVITLSDTVPVTSGEGSKKSTNYVPVFEIVSWVGRPPDLVYKPKAQSMSRPATGSAPMTGSRQVSPPSSPAPASDDDFG